MTTELTKLREALRRVKYEAVSLADAQVIALEALTQRPAAQTEREAFEARVVAEAGEGAIAKWLGTDGYENTRVQDYRLGWVWCLEWQARASLPTQQAAGEPVAQVSDLFPSVRNKLHSQDFDHADDRVHVRRRTEGRRPHRC